MPSCHALKADMAGRHDKPFSVHSIPLYTTTKQWLSWLLPVLQAAWHFKTFLLHSHTEREKTLQNIKMTISPHHTCMPLCLWPLPLALLHPFRTGQVLGGLGRDRHGVAPPPILSPLCFKLPNNQPLLSKKKKNFSPCIVF